jgi:hypothetical protein
MKNILKMGREEILALEPSEVVYRLNVGEVLHIADLLGAFWYYDYDAADN